MAYHKFWFLVGGKRVSAFGPVLMIILSSFWQSYPNPSHRIVPFLRLPLPLPETSSTYSLPQLQEMPAFRYFKKIPNGTRRGYVITFELLTHNTIRGFCPLVRQSVGPLIRPSRSSWKCETPRIYMLLQLKLSVFVLVFGRGVWGGVEVRLEVGCPCPPVRINNICCIWRLLMSVVQ